MGLADGMAWEQEYGYKEQLNKTVVSKRLFSCDICGEEKSGRKFPVLDENWNKQVGLSQCADCFGESCGFE